MSEFAIHDGSTVINIIVADSLVVAQSLTDAEVVEMIDGQPSFGWTLHDDGWRSPQPYASWVWNSETREWEAPVPLPVGGWSYAWDEAAQEWVEVPAPPWMSE